MSANAFQGKKRRAPSSPSNDIKAEPEERGERPTIPPNAPTAPRRMMSNLGNPSGGRALQRSINTPAHGSDVSSNGLNMTNPGELGRVVGLAERLEVIARELIDAHAHIHNLERQLADAKADNDKLERRLAEAKTDNELQQRVLDDMEMRIAALEAWEEADDQERR